MSITAQTSARKRINALLDDNSFVEIGALVTSRNTDFNLNSKDTPADGVITGYGTIHGKLAYVYSQDTTVLSGSVGEMHAKKIVGIYDLALKMGAPVVGLIDCAGLRLQEATDSLNAFGEIYLKQTMASGVIPQITGVMGYCGGGLAIIPALTDFTFMEEKKARLFINSPNVIDGNYAELNDISSCGFQSQKAGLVDFTGSEDFILEEIRALIGILPSNYEDEALGLCQDDLNRLSPDLSDLKEDAAAVFASISDDHFFMEARKKYAPEMVTGFIKINGATIGAIGNRTAIFADGEREKVYDNLLTPEGCTKASEFIRFCDAFSIPLLSITNTKGYQTTIHAEKIMARAAAALTLAFANASVPKVNLIIGEAFGSAYITMNSKAIGADLTYAWPGASIGTMDPMLAAKIMYTNEPELIHDKAIAYNELQSNALSAAKRGYVDGIIDPQETRKYMVSAFEMLYAKKTVAPDKKHSAR